MPVSNESPTLPRVGQQVWGADDIQRIVDRNAKWITAFIVAGVKAVMRDGRPLFTEKTSEAAKLAALLQAPPQFWDALEAQDPETAAALVADVLRAREKGKIPAEGPRAGEVPPEIVPADGTEVGKPGTGTERAVPLPTFTRAPTDLTVG